MSFSARAINAARAIVSTFETYPPTARPNYAQLAVLPDGPGRVLQVTFGAHQATDRADSLDEIIKRYAALALERGEGALNPEWLDGAELLTVYLPRLAKNTPQSCADLATDADFKTLLKRVSTDPLMHQAQNEVFDENYMRPAIAAVEGSGWIEPLSLAVVYDSMIHGGWRRLRNKVQPAGEHEWISRYVAVRDANLANAGGDHSIFDNKLLRNTVYRTATLRNLIHANNWHLATPFVAHGVTVTEDDISAWE